MSARFIACLAATALLAGAANAGEATPLFRDEATISIRITGPIDDIARAAAKSTDPHPAKLELEGGKAESHAIELSARGLSRRKRDVCQFPPLKVRFAEKPAAGSLFEKQRTLKLVTHCRSSKAHEQFVLLEYAAYRLYNVVTPKSFRVRLAAVDYVDAKSGKTVASRAGFFIEDIDDLAARVDLKEVERPAIAVAALDPKAAADEAVFQYMIANLDWDATAGPPGAPCCHNGKVLGTSAEATAGLAVIPYDFDHAGLIDAPYGAPVESLGAKTVRTRIFRGFCRHNAEAAAAAARFSILAPQLRASLAATPGLKSGASGKASRFLDEFFEIAADSGEVEKRMLKKCRG